MVVHAIILQAAALIYTYVCVYVYIGVQIVPQLWCSEAILLLLPFCNNLQPVCTYFDL